MANLCACRGKIGERVAKRNSWSFYELTFNGKSPIKLVFTILLRRFGGGFPISDALWLRWGWRFQFSDAFWQRYEGAFKFSAAFCLRWGGGFQFSLAFWGGWKLTEFADIINEQPFMMVKSILKKYGVSDDDFHSTSCFCDMWIFLWFSSVCAF